MDCAADRIQRELRKIPSVTTLLAAAANAGIFRDESEALRTQLTRAVLGDARARVQAGDICPEPATLLASLKAQNAEFEAQNVRRVVNATGIVLHTNLGRAPLPSDVLTRVVEMTTGYCSLEMDLAAGNRGERALGVRQMLLTITGAEAAAVVNNGAAAVYLTLAALAHGKEVVVSRGELVQIGGGFRVPDILAASGAHLKEVGTTNITTLEDFENALSDDTALLMKIHRSNFQVSGHTAEPTVAALTALALCSGRPLVFDLGSGGFVRWSGHDPQHEPTVHELIRAGVDLVCFSGDKLVGGPQSGIIVGRSALIEKIVKHPMYRAMRVGRLTVAALQEVLKYYVHGRHRELTHWAMIEMPPLEHQRRTETLVAALQAAGVACGVVNVVGAVGGGAAPEKALPSAAISIKPKNSGQFLELLRRHATPVIPRIEREVILLDVRTMLVDEEALVIEAVKAAWAADRC